MFWHCTHMFSLHTDRESQHLLKLLPSVLLQQGVPEEWVEWPQGHLQNCQKDQGNQQKTNWKDKVGWKSCVELCCVVVLLCVWVHQTIEHFKSCQLTNCYINIFSINTFWQQCLPGNWRKYSQGLRHIYKYLPKYTLSGYLNDQYSICQSNTKVGNSWEEFFGPMTLVPSLKITSGSWQPFSDLMLCCRFCSQNSQFNLTHMQ